MTSDESFLELLARIQAGDPAAEQLLFERYDKPIRRAARMRTMHGKLQRLMDSEDIRQSVMRSFFVRVRAGELSPDSPGQLVALLLEMTRNKVADQVRKATALKRGGSSLADPVHDDLVGADGSPDPVEQAINREIETMVLEAMSPEERALVRLRREGADWQAIAGELSSTPEAIRKRHERLVARLSTEFDLL